MKKLLSLSAAAVAAYALAGAAHAQVISVQFDANNGNNISANGEVAGVIPESVWNADNNTATYFSEETTGLSSLVDSTGMVSGISETKDDFGGYHAGGGVTHFATNTAGNGDLYGDGVYLGQSSQNLKLTGLSAGDVYNLFIYVQNPNGQGGATVTANATVDGVAQSLALMTIANSSMTAFVPATPTSLVTAPVAGNYFEFAGITGVSSFTASLLSAGGGELNGFQLQDVGTSVATPEPSAIWLLSLGLLSVGFFVRRNRAAREI